MPPRSVASCSGERSRERSGEQVANDPGSPCCRSRLIGLSRWRVRCGSCAAEFPRPCLRAVLEGGRPVLAVGVIGYRVTIDPRGRPRVFLGKGHPFANSAGWQYLYRWVVMEGLGTKLRADEHVHHRDYDLANSEPGNLEVLAVAYHGRLHASAALVAQARTPNGRFGFVQDATAPIFSWPRSGPILGPAAARQR